MDLVLGLGMTSRAVRWVLVEGTTGEGTPVDRGAIAIDDVATYDSEGLLHGLVDDTVSTGENRIHAIGVTWTSDAAPLAGRVLDALEQRGHANVFAVSEVEAAGLLTTGIAEIAGYDDVAVCIVEPDAAAIATVTPDAVTTDRIGRAPEDEAAEELIGNIVSTLQSTGGQPAAVFVLGSDGSDSIVSALAEATPSPVISAAESDLAYARGAGLAAALAVNTQDGLARSGRSLHLTKVGALTSVLVAAVATLVVATTAVVGIRLHPGAFADAPEVAEVSEPAPAAKPQPAPPTVKPSPREVKPSPPAAKPRPAPPAAPPSAPKAPAPVAEVDNAPAYVPPPAPTYIPPPEPAYVPPAPPAFVPPPAPPAVTYPQPRLRDRIIERIPIIGRFHEPKPWG
ncbi:DUF7159 family protein [Mycolicibacterium sp. XJ870]